MTDPTGMIAANIIGAIIGGVLGAVGGAFLGKWLADRLGISPRAARIAFISTITLLVGVSSSAIGYFIGPYIAKAWALWSARLVGLLKGTYKSIERITSYKMDTHINVPKHLWGRVMKNVNPTQIQSIIYQAIRKGTWALQSNGSIKITYRYNGQIVVVTGNIVKNVFKVGNAWVWNGYGKP